MLVEMLKISNYAFPHKYYSFQNQNIKHRPFLEIKMNPYYYKLFRKSLLWTVFMLALCSLGLATFQTRSRTQTILSQAPIGQTSALSNALYQDFLYTAKNTQLQVGNTFPKHIFQTPNGESFSITGKRTLLFVRGSLCGSCDKIIETHKDKLEVLKITIVSAISTIGASGMPSISYGKTADATSLTPSTFGTLTSGNLKEVVRHPFGLGAFLIDEANIVRYVSFGFNKQDPLLPIAIQGINKKFSSSGKAIDLKKPLTQVTWKNLELTAFLKRAKALKASLVIASSDTCATCNGLATELKGFFQTLVSKGYGVFYLSKSTTTQKIRGVTFINDKEQEWLKGFNTAFYPSSFILKGDRYGGQVYYSKVGSDPTLLSDIDYRNATLRALDFVAKAK